MPCECLCLHMFEMMCRRGTGYFWGKRKRFLVGSVCEFMDVCVCVCVHVCFCVDVLSDSKSGEFRVEDSVSL